MPPKKCYISIDLSEKYSANELKMSFWKMSWQCLWARHNIYSTHTAGGDDNAESKYQFPKITKPQTPFYPLTYKWSWRVEKNLPADTNPDARIFPLDCEMGLRKRRCSPFPIPPPQSLSVCLYETEERQTMGDAAAKWPLCMTELKGWKEDLFCGSFEEPGDRSSSHAAVFPGHGLLGRVIEKKWERRRQFSCSITSVLSAPWLWSWVLMTDRY